MLWALAKDVTSRARSLPTIVFTSMMTMGSPKIERLWSEAHWIKRDLIKQLKPVTWIIYIIHFLNYYQPSSS